jgi:hypothetical protein
MRNWQNGRSIKTLAYKHMCQGFYFSKIDCKMIGAKLLKISAEKQAVE